MDPSPGLYKPLRESPGLEHCWEAGPSSPFLWPLRLPSEGLLPQAQSP